MSYFLKLNRIPEMSKNAYCMRARVPLKKYQRLYFVQRYTPACLYSVFCLPIINLPSWTRFVIYENNKKICQMKAALSFHWLLILHFIAVINRFLTAKHLKTRGIYITANDERHWTWKYCIQCNLQILRKRTANFSFTSTSQKFQGNRCWGFLAVGWSCMLHILCCTLR